MVDDVGLDLLEQTLDGRGYREVVGGSTRDKHGVSLRFESRYDVRAQKAGTPRHHHRLRHARKA